MKYCNRYIYADCCCIFHSKKKYLSHSFITWKDSSPVLIKRTLSKAEDTAKYAALLAAPVVQTLERPIHVVDTLACKTLDKMEDSLPAITHTPEQVSN